MKFKNILPIFLMLTGLLACAPENTPESHSDPEMDSYIAELMVEMTLEEKIGQINLVSVGFDVTGPRVSEDVEEKIVNGQVGGGFSI